MDGFDRMLSFDTTVQHPGWAVADLYALHEHTLTITTGRAVFNQIKQLAGQSESVSGRGKLLIQTSHPGHHRDPRLENRGLSRLPLVQAADDP